MNNNFPEDLINNRLFCLNKDINRYYTIDNIRSIAVSNTLIKNLQQIISKDLNSFVKDKISIKQIDFIGLIGTEINLMKLREKSLRCKIENKNKKICFL